MSDSPTRTTAQRRTYRFGPFRLDVDGHELQKDGIPVSLGPKAFSTLVVLVEGRGRVVPKEELLKTVWPDTFVSDESLSQSIWGLRRALGDETSNPAYITTIPRRGYRFIAPVLEDEVPATADPAPAEAAGSAPAWVATPLPASHRAPWRMAVLGTVCAGVAALATWGVMQRQQEPQPVIRFHQPPPTGAAFSSGGVLSPDGRMVAFLGQDLATGSVDLWVRPIDGAPRRLPGTTGATSTFWSPDGRALAFVADSKLKRIELVADAPQILAQLTAGAAGGTWHSNGRILIAQGRTGIFATSATGGMLRQVTAPDRAANEWVHRAPQFLPDGRHFLFLVISTDTARTGTYIGDLDGTPPRLLLDGTHNAVTYAPPGYLLFGKGTDLIAMRFNTTTLAPVGAPAVIASDVASSGGISASDGGFLVFGGGRATHLTWFDREGRRTAGIDSPTALHNPMLLRGERQVLATSNDASRGGIWMVDLERGASTWLVRDGAAPLPSPDGATLTFSAARREGIADLYRRAVNDATSDELLLQTPTTKSVQDWSPDGAFIVYSCSVPGTGIDLWLLPMTGSDRTPRPYLQTPFDETQARVSPDGRWMAYVSNESGRREVVVQAFPTPGPKLTVSTRGGSQPVWRSDGRELYYLAPDQTLFAVPVTAAEPMRFGTPVALFRAQVLSSAEGSRAQYAVADMGRRFLVDAFDNERHQPITVIYNWTSLIPQ